MSRYVLLATIGGIYYLVMVYLGVSSSIYIPTGIGLGLALIAAINSSINSNRLDNRSRPNLGRTRKKPAVESLVGSKYTPKQPIYIKSEQPAPPIVVAPPINPEQYLLQAALDILKPSTNNITVVGVGCSGINSVDHMVAESLSGIDTVAIDSDLQMIAKSTAQSTIYLGEDKKHIREHAVNQIDGLSRFFENSESVIFVMGAGGKTGTYVTPVLAKKAKEMGKMVYVFVTEPFSVQGKQTVAIGEAVIRSMAQYVDYVAYLSNEDMLTVFDESTVMTEVLDTMNNIWTDLVYGIQNAPDKYGSIINEHKYREWVGMNVL